MRLGLAELWDADLYGLDEWKSWRAIPGDRRQAALHRLAGSNLADNILIERLGVSFCARMRRECRSPEMQAWYTRQGADEARHLEIFLGYAPGLEGSASSPEFGELLTAATSGSNPGTRVLITQVLLEAWGLRHYSELKKHCRSESLALGLSEVLADEVEHQRSGKAIFATLLESTSPETLRRALVRLFDLVRAGPVTYQHLVEDTVGPLTPGERLSLRRALGHPARTEGTLKYLGSVLSAAGLAPMTAALAESGHLEPCP